MLNSRDISLLRSDVAANCYKLLELCESQGLKVLVTDTVRDKAYQEYCYKKGTAKTKTPTFHSVAAGLAFDICQNIKGYEYSDTNFFKTVAVIAKEMGFTWGGDWTTFKDMPHFQWDYGGKYSGADILAGRLPPDMPLYGEVKSDMASYVRSNNIDIVAVPVSQFKVIMCDTTKKGAGYKNYANAGFFGTYKEGGTTFTLPAAHLVCDYAATNSYTKKYCTERGKFNGVKYSYDAGMAFWDKQFYGKYISTLTVSGGKAKIEDISRLPASCEYAISGVPIMRNGADVKFATYVTSQGWNSSVLYATYHTFIGIKAASADVIYVMGMKTTKGNMITAAEAYKKFKALGFYDVIKLDGGGSYHFVVNNSVKSTTSENRRINSIIYFGSTGQAKTANPYTMPTKTLKLGSIGTGVKWVQQALKSYGYACGVDGIFGANTRKFVKAFQTANGLDADGIVGALTRAALAKI